MKAEPSVAAGAGVFARLEVIAAAAFFSTGGAAIKACDLTNWQVAGFRSGVAALTVAALMPRAVKGLNGRVAAVGLAYAATVVSFVAANKLTTAASTIFLQGSFPLYVLLLGPRLLGEPTRRGDLLFVAAIALGLSMFFFGTEAPIATAPDPLRGNLLAVGSGFCLALTVMGLRWLSRSGIEGASASALVAGNATAFLVCLPLVGPLPAGSARDWTIILFLGVGQLGVAYLLLSRGMRRVPALEASLLLMLEPVLNPVWAWLVHGERPGTGSLAGGGIILGVTALKSWRDSHRALGAIRNRL